MSVIRSFPCVPGDRPERVATACRTEAEAAIARLAHAAPSQEAAWAC